MENHTIPINLIEEQVELQLDRLMKAANMCQCEICRADVWALALNHLQPRYVVSHNGKVFSRYNLKTLQSETDITVAIMKGINIVKSSPHHD